MIKKISFLPDFIPLIKEGRKTVTRRIKLKKPGIYYFTAGRSKKKQGYIQIVEAWKQPLAKSFYLDIGKAPCAGDDKFFLEEIEKEGFNNLTEFINLWDNLVPEGYEWPKIKAESFEIIDPEIWRIEFRYLGEEYEYKNKIYQN